MIQPNAGLGGSGHGLDARRRLFPCPQYFGPATKRPLSIEASAKLDVSTKLANHKTRSPTRSQIRDANKAGEKGVKVGN